MKRRSRKGAGGSSGDDEAMITLRQLGLICIISSFAFNVYGMHLNQKEKEMHKDGWYDIGYFNYGPLLQVIGIMLSFTGAMIFYFDP